MRRIAGTIIIALMLLGTLGAMDTHFSPLNSMAYSGRFYDYLANPAALPLVERSYGTLSAKVEISDDYTGLSSGETLSGVENQAWDTSVSFTTHNLSFTGTVGSQFVRNSEEANFNVYSKMQLQLDVAYSWRWFSIGMRIYGGNSMVRRDRDLDNVNDMFINAWFSPFESNTGSDEFDLGAGALFTLKPFSAGIYFGKIMTMTDGGDLYMGSDTISANSTVSLAMEANRYTKEGELLFIRPRLSISFTGLTGDVTRYIDLKGDLTFQFLPNADLTLAVSYLEEDYSLFSLDVNDGYFSFALRGGYSHVYAQVVMRFKSNDWSQFAPSVAISYIN